MIKVLWVSPNLNNYKYKFLNWLNSFKEVEITILKGNGFKNRGHVKFNYDLDVKVISINVSKNKFGFSMRVRKMIKKIYKNYDYVMIPRERKNIFLIIYFFILKINSSIKLFSYNHPISFSKKKL